MPRLSEHGRAILDRMQPDRRYDLQELRVFAPEASIERLREIMHELWVSREVERVGYSEWRCHRSAPAHAPRPVTREPDTVKPEDLFDHDQFADFFK